MSTTFQYALIGAAVGTALAVGYAFLRDKPSAFPSSNGPRPKPGNDKMPPPPVPQECPPTGTRVALIGDSFAEGLGPHMATHAARCGAVYGLDARRGSSVTSWAKDSWIDPVLAQHPSVVLISLGGNDFQRGDGHSVRRSIAELVMRIRNAGARPMWIEPVKLPFEDKTGSTQAWKAAVGDDWFSSAHLDPSRAPDRIHLFPSGYQTWAAEIWPWMSIKLSA